MFEPFTFFTGSPYFFLVSFFSSFFSTFFSTLPFYATKQKISKLSQLDDKLKKKLFTASALGLLSPFFGMFDDVGLAIIMNRLGMWRRDRTSKVRMAGSGTTNLI